MKIFICLLLLIPSICKAQLTEPSEIWDSIKNNAMPVIAPGFTDDFELPYKQPLAAYGWEDGLQISNDGLNLYTLYSPSDLLSWINYISVNIGLPVCNTFGNMEFLRHYANDYGMDLSTNVFGCDSALNIDILYAHRNSVEDAFSGWELSGIARPALIEGGPFPLFSETDPDSIDHFLFTGNSDIWMINHTTANPSDIETAIRLPSPINPESDEFNADNPILKRINNSDTLLLVYEKYVLSETRDFMYTQSYDDGINWELPTKIITINNDAGHIEHPQLYSDANGTWLYYSVNYDIWRAKQSIPNNWDSWTDAEPVILKGNALAIGEPSLTENGDISFLVAYDNTTAANLSDKFDCDPWYVKHINTGSGVPAGEKPFFTISPNPSDGIIKIISQLNVQVQLLRIITTDGLKVYEEFNLTGETEVNLTSAPSGIYFVQIIFSDGRQQIKKIILY